MWSVRRISYFELFDFITYCFRSSLLRLSHAVGVFQKITIELNAYDLGMPAAIGNFHSSIQTKWHVNIELPCITSGIPVPNVKWTLDGQPIESHLSGSVYDNFTLHLDSVTSMDTGNYTCTAWNVYGSENVTTSLLVVGK